MVIEMLKLVALMFSYAGLFIINHVVSDLKLFGYEYRAHRLRWVHFYLMSFVILTTLLGSNLLVNSIWVNVPHVDWVTIGLALCVVSTIPIKSPEFSSRATNILLFAMSALTLMAVCFGLLAHQIFSSGGF